MKRCYLLPPLLSALASAALLCHDAARAETDFHDIPTDGRALVVAAGDLLMLSSPATDPAARVTAAIER